MSDGTLVFTDGALVRRYFAKIERVLGAFGRIADPFLRQRIYQRI